MKIYVLAAKRADDEVKGAIVEATRYLESKGHQVNKERAALDDKKPQYSEEELSQYHRNMINAIKQCDVMVVDISTKSSGLGYQIAVGLAERKPILTIHKGTKTTHTSLSLRSNPSKLMTFRNYETKDELKGILDEFLKAAKDQIDTKFILIISPEIDKYLTWVSDERRMHKAQVVRNAVEDALNRDKEYKQFLKDQGIA